MPPTTDDTLRTALAHHQAGRLDQAESLYRFILSQNPHHADALHLLGLLAHSAGQHAVALGLVRRAIAANPQRAEFFANLAEILRTQAALPEAITAAAEALRLDPRCAAAAYHLGLAQRDASAFPEAIFSFRHALILQPNYPEALNNLGLTLQSTRQLAEAHEAFTQLLALQPQNPQAHSNLGVVLTELQKFPAAIASFQNALELNPAYAPALANLAAVLREQGDHSTSIETWQKPIALTPKSADAYRSLGLTFLDIHHFDEAISACKHATELDPASIENHRALGRVLAAVGPEHRSAAIAAHRAALALDPASPALQFELTALEQGSVSIAPPEYVRELFDNYAPRFEQALMHQLSYQVPKCFFETLTPFLASGKKIDILDLGCGTGLVGEFFHPHARSLIGVDLAPNMIDLARRKEIYTELVVGDLLPVLRARRNSFDLILAGDVFVYVGDLAEIFVGAANSLRPAGLFAFSVEEYQGEDFILHEKKRFAHSLHYLRVLAAKNAFSELAIQAANIRTESSIPVPGWIIFLQKHA